MFLSLTCPPEIAKFTFAAQRAQGKDKVHQCIAAKAEVTSWKPPAQNKSHDGFELGFSSGVNSGARNVRRAGGRMRTPSRAHCTLAPYPPPEGGSHLGMNDHVPIWWPSPLPLLLSGWGGGLWACLLGCLGWLSFWAVRWLGAGLFGGEAQMCISTSPWRWFRDVHLALAVSRMQSGTMPPLLSGSLGNTQDPSQAAFRGGDGYGRKGSKDEACRSGDAGDGRINQGRVVASPDITPPFSG